MGKPTLLYVLRVGGTETIRRKGVRELIAELTPVVARADAELCDIERVKEHDAVFLRIYIDTPSGAGLEDCERVHRAVAPLLEDIEYDYLEVSSPGIDRPLKRPRDFERNLGKRVEIRLYHADDGQKVLLGVLEHYGQDDSVRILPDGSGEARTFARKELALVKLSAEEEIRRKMERMEGLE